MNHDNDVDSDAFGEDGGGGVDGDGSDCSDYLASILASGTEYTRAQHGVGVIGTTICAATLAVRQNRLRHFHQTSSSVAT